MSRPKAAYGGIMGPAAFAVASVAAARRQPGYSPIRHHVSGLAARGTESAAVMVPGFVALGVGQLALGSALARVGAPRGMPTVVRVAGVTTIAAGVFQARSPECPLPDDPDFEPTDLRHGVASVATFACWVALPVLATIAGDATPGWPAWHARLARRLIGPTVATFLGAGATTRAHAPTRGLAQRAFLATALAELVATALAALTAASDG